MAPAAFDYSIILGHPADRSTRSNKIYKTYMKQRKGRSITEMLIHGETVGIGEPFVVG